jgi:hypothetical protein
MSTSVRLTNIIICYPHLFERHTPPGANKAKYSAEFLLDPAGNAAAVQEITAAFQAVATAAGKQGMLQYLKSPLKDGSQLNQESVMKGKKARPELEGKLVLRASDASYAPAVVNAQMQPIPESSKSQIFGGCIVNAFVDIYWSGNQVNPGVYAGLRGVQLVSNVNVTPIGGTGALSPEEMFEAVPGAPPAQQPAQEQGPSQSATDQVPWL